MRRQRDVRSSAQGVSVCPTTRTLVGACRPVRDPPLNASLLRRVSCLLVCVWESVVFQVVLFDCSRLDKRVAFYIAHVVFASRMAS
jgi:hypothetical protein